MAAGDRDARRGADLRAAAQDRAHHLDRDFSERNAEDRERHDRLGAHRVDVGDGVGRGDAAEIARIIHDRHEEVGGGDDAEVLVDLPDGRVVAGLVADEKLAVGCGGGLPRQEVLQDRGRKLAPATAAMGETRQASGGGVHVLSPMQHPSESAGRHG